MTDTTTGAATQGQATQDQATQQAPQGAGAASQTDAGKGAGGGGGAGAKAGGADKGGQQAQTGAGADGGGGAQGADKPWFDGLPDDLKAEKTVLRHANLEDAIRAGVGAEKRLGVPADQLVRLPTKPEEYADVYRKLGAPETAEGYQIGLPDKATDEDKALLARFQTAMFEKGPFPPDMVKAAVEFINGETLAGQDAEASASAELNAANEALLKKELGAAYDPDMKAVGKMLADHAGEHAEALAAELDAGRMGANPRLMLALHAIMDRLGEPQGIEGQNRGTGTPGGITPSQARAARMTLENDAIKGVALRDASHPMHKSVLEERSRLLRLEEGIAD